MAIFPTGEALAPETFASFAFTFYMPGIAAFVSSFAASKHIALALALVLQRIELGDFSGVLVLRLLTLPGEVPKLPAIVALGLPDIVRTPPILSAPSTKLKFTPSGIFAGTTALAKVLSPTTSITIGVKSSP